MKTQDDKIATSQVAIGISSIILGAGIITLPRGASEKIGTPDAWISILIAGLIAMATAVLCAKLSQRYPGKTFYEFSTIIVGRPIGYLLNIAFVIYWIMLAVYELRVHAEVIRHFLLDQTPIGFTSFGFMAVGLYIVMGGINPILRLFELMFPMTTIIFVGVLLLGTKNLELQNFRPILSEGIMPVINGLQATALSYVGFEAILMFAAFMSEPRKAVKAVILGLILPIVIYFMTLVVVVGDLTADVVSTLTWPTIEMIKSLEFPGAFFTNLEIFFIAVWIIQIFTTYIAAHYLASLGMSQMFRVNIKYFHIGFWFLIYFLALYPDHLNTVFKLGDYVGYLDIILAGIMPIFLLIISYIQERVKRSADGEHAGK